MAAEITRSEFTAALRAADIDFKAVYPRTTVESFHITAEDGGTADVGLNCPDGGVEAAYYIGDPDDSDATSFDWFETVELAIADLQCFLGRGR